MTVRRSRQVGPARAGADQVGGHAPRPTGPSRESASGNNAGGVAAGTSDTWTLHVVSQSGNSLTLYDERSGPSEAVNATVSGHTISYSGDRCLPALARIRSGTYAFRQTG